MMTYAFLRGAAEMWRERHIYPPAPVAAATLAMLAIPALVLDLIVLPGLLLAILAAFVFRRVDGERTY